MELTIGSAPPRTLSCASAEALAINTARNAGKNRISYGEHDLIRYPIGISISSPPHLAWRAACVDTIRCKTGGKRLPRLLVRSFAVSIDGYGAGPNQDLQNPLGVK